MNLVCILVVFMRAFPLSCNPREVLVLKVLYTYILLAFATFWTCKLRYEELVFYYNCKIYGVTQEIRPMTCVLDLEGIALG
jgi:hypothetical protein